MTNGLLYLVPCHGWPRGPYTGFYDVWLFTSERRPSWQLLSCRVRFYGFDE